MRKSRMAGWMAVTVALLALAGVVALAQAQENAAPAEPATPAAPATPAPEAAPAAPAAATPEAAAPAAPAAAAEGATTASAPAQAASEPAVATPAVDEKLADQWRNLLHYIIMSRTDLAQSFAKAIVDAKPQPKELYYLWVNSDRSGLTLARGRKLSPELAASLDQISDLINQGAVAVRSDPTEIARWIEMLAGNPQEFLNATERLVLSGQYAVPQLINVLMDVKTSPMLRDRVVTVLPKLGKDAVRPLVEALQVKDPGLRDVICRSLGSIGYAHAAPYLKELAERKDVLDRTRDAALGALAAVAGKNALQKPASELFYELADNYYNHKESVNPDARYDAGNIWYWKEGLGLTYKQVPTVIFNDVYAMRTAREALALDPCFEQAVSLWLAAYIRKEANLPEGATDPTQVAGQPQAMFYAEASGSKYMQAVLTRALADHDEKVALAAITALAGTAGAENLVMPVEGGAQPLVAALAEPSRQVRYLAAETLVNAQPQKRFSGFQLVVPVMVEALRQSGTMSAVLIDPNPEERNKTKDMLRGAGLTVIDAESMAAGLQAARSAGGADLFVLSSRMNTPEVGEAINCLRGQSDMSRLPVIILADPDDVVKASQRGRTDNLIVVLPSEGLDAKTLAAALEQARARVAGPTAMSPELSAQWAVRAANALGLLAMTCNPVYETGEAVPSLISATKDNREAVRNAAANALAYFRSAPAQQAIADLANDAVASEPVRLNAYASLATSVRKFGRELTEKQIKAVREVVAAEGPVKLRDAAAQVLGSLSLPSEMVKDLIVSSPSVQPK